MAGAPHAPHRTLFFSPGFGRRGFTVVEILVCVLILGVLFAVALSATQAARAAARRIQCVANLRQIGIALNSYHSKHNMFPSSQWATKTGWTLNCLSEHAQLLADLEFISLYNSINMCYANSESAAIPALENRTARQTRVDLFVCPADGAIGSLNSYRFNRGRFGVGKGNHPFDGPFSIGVQPSHATVTDGLQNTAFVSERFGGSFNAAFGDPFRDVKVPSRPPPFIVGSDQDFIPYCLGSDDYFYFPGSGKYWLYTGFSFTSYNHNGRPNDPRPSCGLGSLADRDLGLHPPRSHHPGGVNVLYGDGHSGLVLDGVSPAVWSSIGTYGSSD